jgi:gliding motility-associated-like protein
MAKATIAYVWNFGDGSPINNQPFVAHTYPNAGTYTATFTAIGAGGCTTTGVPTQIFIKAAPVANFVSLPAYSAQLPQDNGNVVFSAQSSDSSIVSWAWDFGDGSASAAPNPAHTYTQAGTYSVQLTVTDSLGCTASVLHGTYTIYSPEVNVPNLFTPNGDGANDTWRLNYTGAQRSEVQVYDRWGRMVYSATNPVAGWDGSIAGSGAAAPSGVYFYVIKIAAPDANHEPRILRGELSLMR